MNAHDYVGRKACVSNGCIFFFADFNLYSLAVIIRNCDVSPLSKSSKLRVALGIPDALGVLIGVCRTDPDLVKYGESVLWEKEG